MDEEEKAKKKTSQIEAETERRREVVDVEQKEMAAKRQEAVDAQAKKIAESREAYEAKSVADEEAEAKSVVDEEAEKALTKVAADEMSAGRCEEDAQENERQIAANDAEIANLRADLGTARGWGAARRARRAQLRPGRRRRRWRGDAEGRGGEGAQNADTDHGRSQGHPGPGDGEAARPSTRWPSSPPRRRSRRASGPRGPCLQQLRQQPWPPVQASLAKVAQEVPTARAHPQTCTDSSKPPRKAPRDAIAG